MALTRFGGYSDTVIVPERLTFVPPSRLSDVEAAAVPVTYLTAAVALYRMAALEADDVVLVHGAAGGVGTAAVQLARLRGARVIGTASSAKHQAVLDLGVDRCIDSRRDDVTAHVMAFTHGRGVDVVLDPRGGASARESYALLAPLGRLVVFGVSDAVPGTRRSLWRTARLLLQMPAFRPLSLMNRNRGVFGLNLGRLWTEASKLEGLMNFLILELEGGRLQPIIARTFSLAEAAAAHRFMHERRNVGKVVLTTP
jgi:NADPH:quinone reductase-like Zn-dependent oxidoreductase